MTEQKQTLSGSSSTTKKNLKSSQVFACLRDRRTKRCRKQVVGTECWLFVGITSDVKAPQLSMRPNACSLRALPRESIIGASAVGERLCASLAMLGSSDTRSSHVLRPILAAINHCYAQCKILMHNILLQSEAGQCNHTAKAVRVALFTPNWAVFGTRLQEEKESLLKIVCSYQDLVLKQITAVKMNKLPQL